MEYMKLKGTYDIVPRESDFYRYVRDTIEGILRDYGYKEIAFPVIEYANMFARGAGESSDIVVKKEMYTFEDRGHRQIALRPEGTASAVRLYLENGLSMQGYSAKMYYSGPMFRAENPQAGRYRQFIQYGVEYIGDGNPFVDVELIQLNRKVFEKLGIEDFIVFINSIGCRDCRVKHLEKLKEYFKDNIESMCEDCKKRYDVNVLRILDCKEEGCRPFIEKAPIMIDSLCENCRTHFENVKKGLEILKISYQIDPRLVRGLDYYNRTVFEIKSKVLGAQSTISAGGRYDYLVREFGGMETPASGFAVGLERLAMVMNAAGKKEKDYYIPPKVYVAFIGDEYLEKAIELIEYFRERNISALTEYRYSSLKKHLKSADSLGVSFSLLVGENEIKSGLYTLRDLSTGDQHSGSLAEIMKIIS